MRIGDEAPPAVVGGQPQRAVRATETRTVSTRVSHKPGRSGPHRSDWRDARTQPITAQIQEHHVQPHQAVLGVVERLRDGGEHLEAQRTPQPTATSFVSTTALNWMLRYPVARAQSTTCSPRARPTPRPECRGSTMKLAVATCAPAAGPVRAHLRASENGRSVHRDDGAPRRGFHPPPASLFQRQILGERVRCDPAPRSRRRRGRSRASRRPRRLGSSPDHYTLKRNSTTSPSFMT